MNDKNNDVDWEDFKKTGSIYSYLRYKGIKDFSDTENETEENNKNGGEKPIGYN